MNILLWVLQAALAWLCIAGGVFQVFKFDDLATTVAAMRETSKALWAVFGTLGILTGLGLILPAALKLYPVLTPISAGIVAVQSLIICGLYLAYGDRAPLPYAAVMALLAAFVCYGRFVLKPF